MKQKILVIGSQGYIGSKLMVILKNNNFLCEGIDIGYFKKGKIGKIFSDQDRFGDANKISESYIKKFKTVIQLADFSNDSINKVNPKKFYGKTKKYTIKIAKICKKFNIKFIYPSSCSVYGIGKKALDEKSSVNPQTYYSKNKLEIENELLKLSDDRFIPIILRLATVFGFSPRIRFDVVINMFIGMALSTKKIVLNSDGLAWRPHHYIDDVCKVIIDFIKIKKLKREYFSLNVGANNNNQKIISMIKKIKKYIPNCKIKFLQNNQNLKINDDLIRDRKIINGKDKRTYIIKFDKIKKILKNRKFTNIDYGVKKQFWI